MDNDKLLPNNGRQFILYQGIMHVFMQIVVYLNIENKSSWGTPAQWDPLTVIIAITAGSIALGLSLLSYRTVSSALEDNTRIIFVVYLVLSPFTEYFAIYSLMERERLISSRPIIDTLSLTTLFMTGAVIAAIVYGILLVLLSRVFDKDNSGFIKTMGWLFIIFGIPLVPLIASSGVAAVFFLVYYVNMGGKLVHDRIVDPQ